MAKDTTLGTDETALVRAAQAGDRAAIERLVDTHWHRAWRASLSILLDPHRAEDLAQESMVKAVGALDSFDAARPFGPWLERLTINTCLDWLRRSSSHEQPFSDLPEPGVAQQFSDPALAASLDELEPLDRAIVVLRHVLAYRLAEIAELVALSESAVGSRLHRAMQKLRTTLTETQEVKR